MENDDGMGAVGGWLELLVQDNAEKRTIHL